MTLKSALRNRLVTVDIVSEWFTRYQDKYGPVPLSPVESDIREIKSSYGILLGLIIFSGGIYISLRVSGEVGIPLLVLGFLMVAVIWMKVIIAPEGSHVVFLEEWFSLRRMLSISEKDRVDEVDVFSEAHKRLKSYAFVICGQEAELQREQKKEKTSLDYQGAIHANRLEMKRGFEELYRQYKKFTNPPPKESFYKSVSE